MGNAAAALNDKERCFGEAGGRNYFTMSQSAGADARPFRGAKTGMAGGGKDIDPATELAEEDEEQALPERDLELDEAALELGDASGPLAAGRAVLLRHAKLAPSSPGVYRMLDAAGGGLYSGQRLGEHTAEL